MYAYWGITPQRVDWVKQTYRKRFGIETELPADEPVPDSDDDQEVQRAVPLRGDRTVAEEPVGVAALLRPVEPAAGCRRYNWDRLPVERMLLWLEQVAAEMYVIT